MKRLIILDVDGVLADLHGAGGAGGAGSDRAEFWANVPPYPWALELYGRLSELGPVLVATALPLALPWAYAGRVEWVGRVLGTTRLLIGPPKTDLAGPGRLLIDDSRETCASWRGHGGAAIDFPRQWLGEEVDVAAVLAEARGLWRSS